MLILRCDRCGHEERDANGITEGGHSNRGMITLERKYRFNGVVDVCPKCFDDVLKNVGEREMKLTEAQAVKKHIEMWDWLAKHPGCEKPDYFRAHKPKFGHGIPRMHCYLCEMAAQAQSQARSNATCNKCPGFGVLWNYHCSELNSPYRRWRKTHDSRLRTKYAKQMADGGRKILRRLQRHSKR